MTTTKLDQTFGRIEIIDALRGFALAGIVFVHMLEGFVAAAIPTTLAESMNPTIWDHVASGFVDFLFRGKFFALFSFLFGLSFFIQMDNGEKRGTSFGARFLWRLVLLFAIGFVHSMFYRGDILTLYALVGVLLIPFFKVDTKWLLAIAGLIFLGLGRFIVFYATQGGGIFTEVDFGPESPYSKNYIELLQNGSITEVFSSNAIEGNLMKAEFQFGIFNRGYLTFAFFLLGLVMGRLGFFKNYLTEKVFLKRLWIFGLALFAFGLLGTIATFALLGQNFDFNSPGFMVGLTFADLINLAMTVLLVAVFVILYKKRKAGNFLRAFIPYGKMALTNYVVQSIVGTYLFFGWGLGYLGKLPNRYVFLIAIAIIAVQMWASRLWLKYFRYGPLEWLWRSLTFFKLYPIKR